MMLKLVLCLTFVVTLALAVVSGVTYINRDAIKSYDAIGAKPIPKVEYTRAPR